MALDWWKYGNIVKQQNTATTSKAISWIDKMANARLGWMRERGALSEDINQARFERFKNAVYNYRSNKAVEEINAANQQLTDMGVAWDNLIPVSDSTISQQLSSGRTWTNQYVNFVEQETRQARLDAAQKEAEEWAKWEAKQAGANWADYTPLQKTQFIDNWTQRVMTNDLPGTAVAGVEKATEIQEGIYLMPDYSVVTNNQTIGRIDPATGDFIEKEPAWWEKANNILQWLPSNIGGTLIQKFGFPAIEKIDLPFMIQEQASDLNKRQKAGQNLTAEQTAFMNLYRKEVGEPYTENVILSVIHQPIETIRKWAGTKLQPSEELKKAYYDSAGIGTRMFQGIQAPLSVALFIAGGLGGATAGQAKLAQIAERGGVAGKAAQVGRVAIAPIVGQEWAVGQLISKTVGGVYKTVMTSVIKRNLSSYAASTGIEIPKETVDEVVKWSLRNLKPSFLTKEAIRTLFKPVKGGYTVTQAGAKAAEQAAEQAVKTAPMLTSLVKTAPTGVAEAAPVAVPAAITMGNLEELQSRLAKAEILGNKEQINLIREEIASLQGETVSGGGVIPTEGKIIPETGISAETVALAEGETITGEVPEVDVIVTGLEGVASTEKPVGEFRAGWEKILRRQERLEDKWVARLVGERSKTIYAQKELAGKPTNKDFVELQNTLKKQTQVRYDQQTGKYLKVRKTVTHVTKANWNALSVDERTSIVESAGLDVGLAEKKWDALTLAEQTLLKTSGITLPSLRIASNNWNKLTEAQREALTKVMGLDVSPKSWQALSKKEIKQLRDAVVGGKTQFSLDEAEDAVVIALDKAIKSKDVVFKLSQLVRLAKPINEITKGLRHEELVKRVGQAQAISEGLEGREALDKSKAALKGMLPEADITPIEPGLEPGEVKELYDMINNSGLPYFTRLNTHTALTKLLSGEIPTDSGLKLLEDMYGGGLGEALTTLRSRGRKIWDTAMSILNLPRAVLASFDLSAPLRQGALLFWGQPKQSLPALKPMVQAFVSEKNAKMIDEIINSGRYAQLRRESKLYIAPLYQATPKIRQREEAFMTKFAEKIPLVAHSERAYITFLNKLRADVFDFYAEQWEGQGKTIDDYKKLASMINIMTGRGELGKLTGIGDILNVAFFSPRYMSSRIMLPYEFVRTNPEVRRIMAKNILAFVTVNLVMAGLIYLAARASGKEMTMEADPRSSDFGKVKIGNTRIDPWAGFQQYGRFVAQLLSGMRKSTTTGEVIESKRADIINWFARSKLSPAAGLVADLLEGETFLGDEFSLEPEAVKEQAFQRLVPMFVQDMVEAIEDSGMIGGLMAFPGLFGVGVQTYGNELKDKYAQAIYGKNWNDLTEEQQNSFYELRPDLK